MNCKFPSLSLHSLKTLSDSQSWYFSFFLYNYRLVFATFDTFSWESISVRERCDPRLLNFCVSFLMHVALSTIEEVSAYVDVAPLPPLFPKPADE